MIMGFAEMSRVFGDAHLKRSAADSKLSVKLLDTLICADSKGSRRAGHPDGVPH